MRLVCPNCEAKYEVPEDAIPDTGRDVQCTNCGHTWFQMRGRSGVAMPLTEAMAEPADTTPEAAGAASAGPGPADSVTPAEPAEEVEAALDAPTPDEPVARAAAEETVAAEAMPAEADVAEPVAAEVADAPVEEPVVEPEPGPESPVDVAAEPVIDPTPAADPEPVPEIAAPAEAVADAPSAEAVEVALDPVTEPEPEPAPAAAAYAVDESVLAILREEAEREANARRSEALESQTDLGIDAAMPGKSRKGGKAAAKAEEPEAKPSARRDLLPDVEEINSTLRPSEAATGDDATPDFVAPPPEAPRGFRSGFLTLMTIAILAAALYVVAPRLAALVPAVAGPLESYVSLIDGMRLGLDGMMRSATVAISGN